MNKFAVSLCAKRLINCKVNFNHVCCIVEANSKEEATGIAYILCEKAYPKNEGWLDQDIIVSVAVINKNNVNNHIVFDIK